MCMAPRPRAQCRVHHSAAAGPPAAPTPPLLHCSIVYFIVAPLHKNAQGAAPAFEWHIIMEFCDKGSLSKELASFK